MILVNVKQTYPAVAAEIADYDPRTDLIRPTIGLSNMKALMGITRGDWHRLSPGYLHEYGDYIAATLSDTVVAVFRVDNHEYVEGDGADRVRFAVSPAPEAAHLIGGPMPGGPWKRGEGRGTRGVPTPGDILPVTAVGPADDGAYYGRIHSVAQAFVDGRLDDLAPAGGSTPPAYSEGDQTWVQQVDVAGVAVRAYSDGVIHVMAPAGRRVVVESIAPKQTQ